MNNKLFFSLVMTLLSISALAQNSSYSQGQNKGQPFVEVQQVLDAASDALAAAVSANTANIEANTAAIDAEEAARLAENAALTAQFAADLAMEILARMEGDMALADALAAEELARIEGIDLLGTRVDALEAGASGMPGADFNEVTYEETTDFDFTGLRDDIFTLDYQAGEWLYMASTFAPTGETSAICTSHPGAYNVLVAYALGGTLSADVASSITYVLEEGSDSWINASASMLAMSFFLKASALNMNTQLVDRTTIPWSLDSELLTNSGPALGSTAVLRVSSDRMAACGF